MCVLLINKIPQSKDPVNCISKVRSDIPNDLLDLLSLLLTKNPDLLPTMDIISEKIKSMNCNNYDR
jgi:hypothetical protein